MKNNILIDKSLDFAVGILKLVKKLQSENETIIANQLCKSGTSIGANIMKHSTLKAKQTL